MPRLNLDIFGNDAVDATTAATQKVIAPSSQAPATEAREMAAASDGHGKGPAVRFVPVGFHEEHLRLLDEAVLSLRRQGKWGASKSAIIRALIVQHAHELDMVWKSAAKAGQACD